MDATLQRLEFQIVESVRDLSAAETQTRLPAKWTIEQIVEHLLLTYSATEKVLAGRIAKGRPTEAVPSLAQRSAQLLILRIGYFPHGRSAPLEVMPSAQSGGYDARHLAELVRNRLEMMDGCLAEVAFLFGARVKSVSHFALGPLNPSEWRRFHLAHGMHHVRQIWATRSLMARLPVNPLHR